MLEPGLLRRIIQQRTGLSQERECHSRKSTGTVCEEVVLCPTTLAPAASASVGLERASSSRNDTIILFVNGLCESPATECPPPVPHPVREPGLTERFGIIYEIRDDTPWRGRCPQKAGMICRNRDYCAGLYNRVLLSLTVPTPDGTMKSQPFLREKETPKC